MNMRSKKRLLLLPLLAAVLPGCNTLTHSPIVFTSRQTIGVDVRPTPSDTSRPGVSIGVRSADFAWIPAVGLSGCQKWKEEKDGVKVTPQDRKFISKDWESKCEIVAIGPLPLLASSNGIKDILSVYGQFDANVGGFASSEGEPLAKVFAVGLAAQLYTKASSAKVRNECLQAVEKFVQDKIDKSTDADITAGRTQIAVLLKQQCAATSRGERK